MSQKLSEFHLGHIIHGWLASHLLTAVFVAAVLSSPPAAGAADRQVVQHALPAAAAQLAPVGRPANGTRLSLAIALPLRNQAALSNLLGQIYNPASPEYHHYLTPEQFTERFGPTEADYQSVVTFARGHGLQVTTLHPNRLLLDVSGTVPAIESALHVTFYTYQHPTENRTFFAPNTQPTLDLATPILRISGLDNYYRPRPHYVTRSQIKANTASANTGSGPEGTFRGGDFRAAYVPGTTLTGTGQTVGLLQFDGYTASDITYYETQAGLPAVTLQNVLLDGFTGYPTGDGGEVETSLDIEMAISMAPGLSKVIVYEAGPYGNWHDLLNRMATDNLARQLSCSWYNYNGVADPVADQIWLEMAAQGQSFFNASGDGDAWTGLIFFPGDSPCITQVGGTTLTTSGPKGAWVAEQVWNSGDGQGSGGGISTQYKIPSWQTNISMTANLGSTTMRNTPDVALTADNVYVRADGMDLDIGGTSCAAPLWAGFAALVNQQAATAGQPAIGFINPALDTLGKSVNYAAAFHDITTGNNEWFESPAKFSAVTGYDLCTGWGTPAGQNLINALANPEPLLITPLNGFAASGGVGGPFTVTSQSLILTNAGTNALTWSLVNTSAWLSVSSSGGTLSPGGPAATLNVSLTATASSLVLGNYTTSLWFTNANDNVGQNRQYSLSIITPPAIAAQPTNQTVLDGATVTFNVAVTGGQPLAFQWQEDGTNLTDGDNVSGSATTNLVLTDVTLAEAGTYTVVVTNAAGTVTSSNAVLSIPPSPPVFTLQPTNQSDYVTESAQFTVAVLGNPPFTYQWLFNSTNLPGATNATLTLSDLALSQSGNYSVLVTNIYGATNSAIAVLTVNPPPPCAPVSVGMTDWWTGNGTANDSVGTNNGTLVGGASYAPGEVDQAFLFDGSSGYVSIPDSPSLDVFVTNITIEAWIKVNQTNANLDWRGIVTKGTTSWRLQCQPYAKTVNFCAIGLSSNDLTGTRNVNDEQWHHVAGVCDGTNMYLYVDGTLDVSQPAIGLISQNSSPIYIGNTYGAPAAYFFNGLIDEVSIYNRALSAEEIQTIYIAGSGGKCPSPVVIITQPTNETVSAGNTATLVVAATGPQPLSYQWTFDEANIDGATNATLSLEDVQPANAGVYSVTVVGLYSSLASSNALLTVLTQPPTILTQPVSQTNYAGTTASFSITAAGSPPITYQWIFNSTNLPGATNATLTLTDLQLEQAGDYFVLVTNAYGATNSTIAVLTVNPPPPCAPVSAGLVSWWSGEGDANDNIGTNNGTLVGGASYAPGEVGQAFLFDGSSGYVSIPDSPSLDSFTTNITIELWLKVNQTSANADWRGIVSKGNTAWELVGTSGSGTLTFTAVSGVDLIGFRSINDEQWHHVAAVYDGTNMYLYVDGTLDASTPATGMIPQNNYPLSLGEDPDGPLPYYFNGLIDEVSLYNRALSAPEIQSIYLAGGNGKCPVPLAITTQPTNETVNAGNSATLAVTASGMQPLNFQWVFNGTNLAGATNNVLTLTNVQPANSGVYWVNVTNLYGSLTSSNALLTVLTQPPTIITQPTNETVNVGGVATLSVSATGTAPLNYQWALNSTNLAGATNTLLTIINAQLTNAGIYTVTITNLYGSVTSSNALLTVLTVGPAITQNPVSRTNAAGTTASFSAAASGTPPLAYQWQRTGTNLNNGGNVSGATTTNLVLTGVQDADAASYVIVVTNTAGSVTSSPALLVVLNPPVILTQPTNQVVLVNSNATFSVTAAGLAPLSYQWLFNGLPLAASNTITTVAGNQSLGGSYSGDGGAATNAGLNYAAEVAVDGTGNLYVCDAFNCVVRKVNTNGIITTVAGNHSMEETYSGDGGAATNAGLDFPMGAVVDGSGNLYFADFYNNVVRKVATNGIITTFAGNHSLGGGYSGDGGPATNAALYNPVNVTMDGTGNLYIAEYRNNVVRKVATNGIITTVAGKHTLGGGYSGDGSAATNAALNEPQGVTLDGAGNLYIADGANNVIRQVNPSGIIATMAGKHSLGAGYSGDGGAATNAALNNPTGVWANSAGTLYIADYYNNVIRVVATNGIITTFAGKQSIGGGYSGDGGAATNAALDNPAGVALDGLANLYIADAHNNVIRKVTGSGINGNSTNGSLTLTDVQLGMAGNYQVTVSNPAGSITSSNALLTVLAPPAFTQQPGSRTNAAGTTATFTATASGTLPLAWQWQKNGTNLSNGGKVAGATTNTLTLTNVQDADNASYTLVITNVAGSLTSSPALLVVIDPPVILTQPTYQVVLPGGTATFSVTASGTAPLSFQWNVNGTNVLGGTNATLVLTNVQLAQAGSYAVTVTNFAGSAVSSQAELIVLAAPVITQNPSGETNVAGTTATFTAVAAGSSPLTYQWQKNGVSLNNGGNVTGAATTTLTLTNVQDADAANYALMITNAFGSVTSSPALLVVLDPPAILTQPTNQEVILGGNVTFSVTASGTSPLSYQWLYNGLPITTGNTITTVAGNQSRGGTYSGDGGAATNAGINYTAGVALDGTGNLYIADAFNCVVRKVSTTGIITTVAGNNSLAGSYSGDGGAATNAGLDFPIGVAIDGSGNLYVADFYNNIVRKVTTNGIITTIAGNHGLGAGYSGDGGPATNATLDSPVNVTFDNSGNLYIAEYRNNVVRKVTTSGIITTVAGKQTLGGGYSGDGGAATNAAFNQPQGVAVDGAGNLYIADGANNVIRQVNTNGTIATIAGNYSLGGGYSGDGRAATSAALNNPIGLTIDTIGNLYIADYGNNVIRKVSTSGIITTLAGNYRLGGGYSGDGGSATNAALYNPTGVALNGLANLYIADAHNNVVRKVTATGFTANSTNSTLALTNVQAAMAGNYQVIISNPVGSVTSSNALLTVLEPPTITLEPASQTNLAGTTATFTAAATSPLPLTYQWQKNGVSVTNGGNTYGVTTPTLTLTNVQDADAASYTVAVTNIDGSVTSSPALLVVIDLPVILSQPTNQMVTLTSNATFSVTVGGTPPFSYQWLFNGLPLSTSNIITTVAGKSSLVGSYSGDGGSATNAGFNYPCGAAMDGLGNLYIDDSHNNVIRKVNANGTIETVAGESSLGETYSGDGGAATNAALYYPNSIAVDGAGNLYIADSHNNVIREVKSSGIITTVAGKYSLGGGYSGDGGQATNAALNYPLGVAVDGAGNLYIAEAGNNVIRKVNASGIITTVAGNFNLRGGYSGDGGAATNASLSVPSAVLVDGAGNLYFVDDGNSVIRWVNTNGIIATFAGNHSLGGGYSGDGAAATNAALNNPAGVAEDGTGNLYIAEYGNNVIRQVNTNGIITTFAGNHNLGGGFSGDGGTATNAAFNNPVGISFDGQGNLYIADTHNYVIRKVTPIGFNVNSTNSTLTLTNVQAGMAGNYQVIISNPAGSVTSSNAILTVLEPPAITLEPASQTNLAGTTATFTAAATSPLPLTYQWQKNGVSVTNGGNVFGATTPALTLTNVQDADAASYTVAVTNTDGSVTSSPALLVVIDLPVILSQPTNQAVTLTSDATFSVTVGGTPPLSYQWEFNGTNILQATNSTLLLTNVLFNQAGNYSVCVTNPYGGILSSNAALVVTPLYHFVWNQIPSPRFANTPFAVVIQAQNPANGPATNFTGTVALTSTNGVPVFPAVSANFIQGVWTGAVTVAQTATNLVLQSSDTFGESALANPINVVNLPALTSFASAGTLLIVWPDNPSGFVLETTPWLFPADWVPVTTPQFKVNDQYEVFIPTSGTNAFFRLRFPGP
jgi:hypothetical protein